MRADCFITDSKGRTIIHNCIWKNTTKYFKLINHYNKRLLISLIVMVLDQLIMLRLWVKNLW